MKYYLVVNVCHVTSSEKISCDLTDDIFFTLYRNGYYILLKSDTNEGDTSSQSFLYFFK